MPLNAKQAASPSISVESPINAMGPKINNQLSLLENKSSELIHTSCIRLGEEAGGMVVVVLLLLLFVELSGAEEENDRGVAQRSTREKQLFRFLEVSISGSNSKSSEDNTASSPRVDVVRLRRMMPRRFVG
jgi:hypothetical protein